MQQANGPRREEALATMMDEGCRHEQAYLIDGAEGPVIVYVMEVAEIEQSERAAEASVHPIDADHKRMMALALGDQVPAELLLDLTVIGSNYAPRQSHPRPSCGL
jgi:hypothetical protein